MNKPTIYFCPNCDNKRIRIVESPHYNLSGYFTFKCQNCGSEFDDNGDSESGLKIDFDKIHRDKKSGYTISIKIDVNLFAENEKIAKDQGIKTLLNNINEKYLLQFVEVQKRENVSIRSK